MGKRGDFDMLYNRDLDRVLQFCPRNLCDNRKVITEDAVDGAVEKQYIQCKVGIWDMVGSKGHFVGENCRVVNCDNNQCDNFTAEYDKVILTDFDLGFKKVSPTKFDRENFEKMGM